MPVTYGFGGVLNSTLESPSCNSLDSPEKSKLTIRLTKREIEVLQIAAQGKISKEIAKELFLSKRTVDFHFLNIYKKLQVSKRKKAIIKAIKADLITI